MSNNARVLLDQYLEEQNSERINPLPADTAFELFACEQVLRGFELSSDELLSGIVGGGNDGGIDGVYAFVGEQLIADDSEIFGNDFSPSRFSSGVALKLLLIQAKREISFSENAIDLASSSTNRLLNFAQTEGELKNLYSSALVDRALLFRQALQRLAIRHPTVHIEFFYATRGDKDTINPKVQQKANDLKEQFDGTVTGAVGLVAFLGADELWVSANTVPNYTLQLTFQENATSGDSHIALASLRDYIAFLSDTNGNLIRHIFDWNVRDYQGDIEVNKEIQSSLEDSDSPDFGGSITASLSFVRRRRFKERLSH